MARITHIITDIEGTTTDIAFVHNVLFPYARQQLPSFITINANRPEVRTQLDAVASELGRPLSDREAVQQLQHWIDEDKKIAPLKNLQGLIWEQGYANNELQGHVYNDAAAELKRWQQMGIQLYIYSSGSVKAQQLIFSHSNHGNLKQLFSGFFDTRIGHKGDTSSYEIIRDALGGEAQKMLFLSDIEAELDAAQAAGLQTGWLVRGNKKPPTPSHLVFSNFAQITASVLQLS